VTQASTFEQSTLGGRYAVPSTAFNVITLGHKKAAGWVSLPWVSTVQAAQRGEKFLFLQMLTVSFCCNEKKLSFVK
jgi:hypothetical protein